jgi:CRISPR-associated protein Cst1
MIYTWTGNPFVDAGISAIQELNEKLRLEDITIDDLKMVAKQVVSLYTTDNWKKNLFSVFPNNPVTNPSIKDKKKRLESYLNELIDGVKPLNEIGGCIACGRRSSYRAMTKADIPLTGSGNLRNYFSFAAEGADYCQACAFAVQCSPLVYYACGKLALIHSNSHKVMRYWAKRCIAAVQRQIASSSYSGCFNEGFTNPMNALFHITQDLILSYEERWVEENATIRIYHFTNYNQGPELDMYDLPSPIFRFLAYVRQHPRYGDWLTVVQRGYLGKLEGKTEDEYKNYRNGVYQRLLSNQSILSYFVDISSKTAVGDWSLLAVYLKEVLQMNDARIAAIKRLGDEIANIIQASPNGRRRLGQLEMAKTYASFRMALLRLMRERIALKDETPLFTFDDYVENLFPDGALGWKETQDLLLFRLYEVLHPWLIAEGIVIEEIEEIEEALEH